MSDKAAPPSLPTWVLLACLAPGVLAGALFVQEHLGGLAVGVPPRVLLVLALLVTVPVALLAVGLRGVMGRVGDADVKAALEAVAAAERVARESGAAIAKAEAALQAQAAARAPGGPAAPRGQPRVALVGGGLLVALLLLGAGALGGAYLRPSLEAAPIIHEHATFALFVDGARVAYTDPVFDMSQRAFLRAHLHVPDQDVVHLEGTSGVTMATLVERMLLGRLEPGRLVLDDVVHGGRVLEDNATHRLQLHVSKAGGPWMRVHDVPGYPPRDLDRVLLTYGTGDPAEIARQQDAVSKALLTR